MKKINVLSYRIIGLCYLAGCIFILINMQFQLGKISEKRVPVWKINSLQEEVDDSSLHQRVSKIVQPLMQKHKHVGIVVATIANDESDITGFGRINLKLDEPPDGDTIFEIGSVTKVFTGILLADAVAKKEVALETSLTSLLPSISIKPDSSKSTITLGHLATHTSGLPRMPANTFRLSSILAAITAGDSYCSFTEEIMHKTFSKTNLRHDPGEHFAYSNVGFGLLGSVLSKQRGMDYHEMVERVIARPLGLKDTGVYLNEEQRSRLPTGYRSYYGIGPFYLAQLADNWEFPNCIAGAGGLHSTANDMLVFLAANMGREKSNLTSTLIDSHTILFAEDKNQIGMGWLHKKLQKSGDTIIWHNGGTGGYSSFFGFSKNGRFGVVIFSNSTKSVDYIGYKILDMLALYC